PPAAQQPVAYAGGSATLSPHRAHANQETAIHRGFATDWDHRAAPSLGPGSVGAGSAPVGTPPAVTAAMPRDCSYRAAPQAGGADDSQSPRPRPAFPGAPSLVRHRAGGMCLFIPTGVYERRL